MTASPMVQALIKAQQAFTPITKGKTAKVTTAKASFSYSYADLGSVLEAVMPALHSNGFALVQPVCVSELGEPLVKTTLMHESGESIESSYPVRVGDPNDPQKVGGGVTFARRYSLISILGLATEDDDGAHAARPREQPAQRPQALPRPSDPEQEPSLFMSGSDTAAWTARVKAATKLAGPERKAELQELWKKAAADRNFEMIEVMCEHLDYDDANKIATGAEGKGLMSSRAIDIMVDRSKAREIEQAQSIPA